MVLRSHWPVVLLSPWLVGLLSHWSVVQGAAAVSGDPPVVISEFLDGCYEIEMDGVGKDGQLICHALAEHVENAG